MRHESLRATEIFSQHTWCTDNVFGLCWGLDIIIIIGLTFLISMLVYAFYRAAHPRLVRTHNVWDDILLRSLHAPLQVGIWLIGVSIAFNNPGVSTAIDTIRDIGIVFAILWAFIKYINFLEGRLLDATGRKRPYDKTTVYAIGKLLRIVSTVIAILIMVQLLGLPMSGVAAFGGGSAVVIGIGARDLISNFFGGMMLYMDKPFKVGDWIRSTQQDIEGTVEYIGWRTTRIRTFDKRALYVPNATFLNLSVENPSRMLHRRIKTTIGVRYDDVKVIEVVTNDIEAMLRSHPDIAPDQTIYVKLVEFAKSSLNIQIYCFTKTTQWIPFQAIQQDVFLKIVEVIHQHGADLAFPTRTLYMTEAADK
jgi:MscS family membrane protein